MHCCCASSVCQATKPICPSCSLNTLQAPCKQLECHQTPLRAEPLRRSLPLIDEAAKADKGWSTGSAVQVASGQGHSSRPPVSVPVYNGRRWQEMAGDGRSTCCTPTNPTMPQGCVLPCPAYLFHFPPSSRSQHVLDVLEGFRIFGPTSTFTPHHTTTKNQGGCIHKLNSTTNERYCF